MVNGKQVRDWMTVRFEQQEASSHNGLGEKHAEGLDYYPLPLVTRRTFAMGVLVSMGGLIFGYDTGQISGFLAMPDFLRRFGNVHSNGELYFSTVRSGLIVALLSIGTLIGALVAAPLADRAGRRPSISLSSLVVGVGFAVQISADRAWYQVMIGRFVSGLGVGALSLLVPMFQAETAPPWIRGALVCAYQLFITLGIFLAACFNYGTVTHHSDSSASWRIVIGLGWVWVLVLGLGILFFPETPRFDLRKCRRDRAARTLCAVYGTRDENHWAVRTQIDEIERKMHEDEDQDRQQGRANTTSAPPRLANFLGMLRAPRMAHRIALGMTLQMLQQLTGANYFFYYGTTIFQSVQIDSFVTQIILNTINFAVTFIGLWLVEHYGRRRSLIAGSAWMFACFLVFASVGHFLLDLDDPAATPTPGIVLIVFAALFILGFATTWGPMVWTIQAELFPGRYRASAMALSTASNWTWNFCIGFFTPFITDAIDFRYGYLFAACNFCAALVVYFFVIEGRGRTLEEIDTMYLEGVRPWRSEQWMAAPSSSTSPPSSQDVNHSGPMHREKRADMEPEPGLEASVDHHESYSPSSTMDGTTVV